MTAYTSRAALPLTALGWRPYRLSQAVAGANEARAVSAAAGGANADTGWHTGLVPLMVSLDGCKIA